LVVSGVATAGVSPSAVAGGVAVCASAPKLDTPRKTAASRIFFMILFLVSILEMRASGGKI
jgi:hypothetical protein